MSPIPDALPLDLLPPLQSSHQLATPNPPGGEQRSVLLLDDTSGKELDPLPEKKALLSMKFNSERARQEEVESLIDDLKKRLEKVEAKTKEYKDELNDVHQRLRSGERVREKLKEELEQLRTGSSR